MLWTILAWLGFFAMLWLGWNGIAFIRAGLNRAGNIAMIVGVWRLIAAIGAFLVWRMGLGGTFTTLGIIGLALVFFDPVFWVLGNVANRLKAEGVRVADILRFK